MFHISCRRFSATFMTTNMEWRDYQIKHVRASPMAIPLYFPDIVPLGCLDHLSRHLRVDAPSGALQTDRKLGLLFSIVYFVGISINRSWAPAAPFSLVVSAAPVGFASLNGAHGCPRAGCPHSPSQRTPSPARSSSSCRGRPHNPSSWCPCHCA